MTTTRRTAATLAALVLAASLAACSTPADAPAANTEQTPAASPSNCLTVTSGAEDKLGEKIASVIPGSEIKRTGLVASNDSDLWILAVEFTDPGLGSEFVGIWGSQQDLASDEDPAFVAVDDIAAASAEYLQPKEFAGGIGAQLSSAEEATACLA